MSGVVPTDDQVELLLCEDVRQEVNGKFMLGGFFPGNQIGVMAVGPTVDAIPLAFFFMIHGSNQGDYNAVFKLTLPSGAPAGIEGRFLIKKLLGKGAVQLVKLPVFVPLESGIWKATLSLDGTDFVRTFQINIDPTLKPSS
jgi:hypothetical protein